MKEYDKFITISNSADTRGIFWLFGWLEVILIIKVRTKRKKRPKTWSLRFDLLTIEMCIWDYKSSSHSGHKALKKSSGFRVELLLLQPLANSFLGGWGGFLKSWFTTVFGLFVLQVCCTCFNTTHKNSRTLVNSRDHMIKWSFFGSQCVLYTGISSFKAFGFGCLLSIEQ